MDRYLCAVAAAGREEPLYATASRVDRWLCVEQPGAWGPDAPPLAGLDAQALEHLRRMAAAARARLVAVRRPGGGRSVGRRVLAADSRPGHERLLATTVDDAALERLPSPWADRTPDGWHPVTAPVYLVCTHGRHDTCCAMFGRPVAQALAAVEPEHTWEVSHIGGDRFAANVVVLPAGVYLGRVPATDAERLVTELRAGVVPAAHYRGRSAFPAAVQAAQHFAAAETGVAAVHGLLPRRVERPAPDVARVVLATDGGELAVTVRAAPSAEAYRLTCHADAARRVPVFSLLSIVAPGP